MALTTLPLSTLIISESIFTHPLISHIHHLEALAHVAPTRFEARHVWRESRDDAVSLLRIKVLFALPSYLLSLAAALSAVQSTLLASHGITPTLHSAAASFKPNWMRLVITTIFVYGILYAFSPLPRAFAALTGARFLVFAIGSGLEVYLMAATSVALVVSIAEERFGWDAIKAGSGLMEGRRVCGWVLSGLFVLVSSLIGSKMERLMDGQDSIGIEDTAVVIVCYGKRHPIREPQPNDKQQQQLSEIPFLDKHQLARAKRRQKRNRERIKQTSGCGLRAMASTIRPLTNAHFPSFNAHYHSPSPPILKWGWRREQDASIVANRTRSQAFRVLANPNVSSGKEGSNKDVIMVDPVEAKRLAAKQMERIKAKEKFKRRRQIEAINGAWAMIGLTAGLVIEGQTGKDIITQGNV
ncbi:hypothetical protein SESBI_06074 [Sesbania bispinosa]|nr:hypothetical protein SESBI_06074 [Sesbania bispinosa]